MTPSHADMGPASGEDILPPSLLLPLCCSPFFLPCRSPFHSPFLFTFPFFLFLVHLFFALFPVPQGPIIADPAPFDLFSLLRRPRWSARTRPLRCASWTSCSSWTTGRWTRPRGCACAETACARSLSPRAPSTSSTPRGCPDHV